MGCMVRGSFVLGLLGALSGFPIALFLVGMGSVQDYFAPTIDTDITVIGGALFLLSIVALVGVAISEANPNMGGGIMLLTGFVMFMVVSTLAVVPGVLLILGGALSARQPKKAVPAQQLYTCPYCSQRDLKHGQRHCHGCGRELSWPATHSPETQATPS